MAGTGYNRVRTSIATTLAFPARSDSGYPSSSRTVRPISTGTSREQESVKKLIIAVVQNEDADNVVDALLEDEFRATRLASTGGFLRRGNTTLMVGADEGQIDRILDLVRSNARSSNAPAEGSEVQSAAATVFVLDLEDYQRL